jgi:hypothetical protein
VKESSWICVPEGGWYAERVGAFLFSHAMKLCVLFDVFDDAYA